MTTLWESQWKLFAPNFKNGKAHIDLAPYGRCKTVLLAPGPGFGDSSHPTTALTLELMAPHTQAPMIIDIGCGSGVLSIAASLLGREHVYGYDIDPEAVLHAQHNAALNQAPRLFHTTPPPKIPAHSLILMNMIFVEQRAAWHAFFPSFTAPARLITSGVLSSHRSDYLSWTQANRWELLQEKEHDGWLAFEFLIKF